MGVHYELPTYVATVWRSDISMSKASPPLDCKRCRVCVVVGMRKPHFIGYPLPPTQVRTPKLTDLRRNDSQTLTIGPVTRQFLLASYPTAGLKRH